MLSAVDGLSLGNRESISSGKHGIVLAPEGYLQSQIAMLDMTAREGIAGALVENSPLLAYFPIIEMKRPEVGMYVHLGQIGMSLAICEPTPPVISTDTNFL